MPRQSRLDAPGTVHHAMLGETSGAATSSRDAASSHRSAEFVLDFRRRPAGYSTPLTWFSRRVREEEVRRRDPEFHPAPLRDGGRSTAGDPLKGYVAHKR